MHGVVVKMIRAAELDIKDTCTPDTMDDVNTNVGWAICSTYYTLLLSSPGAAIFERDMYFDISYHSRLVRNGEKKTKIK